MLHDVTNLIALGSYTGIEPPPSSASLESGIGNRQNFSPLKRIKNSLSLGSLGSRGRGIRQRFQKPPNTSYGPNTQQQDLSGMSSSFTAPTRRPTVRSNAEPEFGPFVLQPSGAWDRTVQLLLDRQMDELPATCFQNTPAPILEQHALHRSSFRNKTAHSTDSVFQLYSHDEEDSPYYLTKALLDPPVSAIQHRCGDKMPRLEYCTNSSRPGPGTPDLDKPLPKLPECLVPNQLFSPPSRINSLFWPDEDVPVSSCFSDWTSGSDDSGAKPVSPGEVIDEYSPSEYSSEADELDGAMQLQAIDATVGQLHRTKKARQLRRSSW
jgi:hypothetical protein